MKTWWMHGRLRHKVEAVVDLKQQTRQLPDGSRVSSLLGTDDLVQYLHEDARTILDSVKRGLRLSENGPMLGARLKQLDGSEPYVWLTYEEVLSRSDAFTYGLIAQNLVAEGDIYVGIFAKNCPEWVIAELGVYKLGGVVVPLYETLGGDAFTYIINQAELGLVICDTEKKAIAILSRKASCPLLKYVVVMTEVSEDVVRMAEQDGIKMFSFSFIEESGHKLEDKPCLKVPKADDLCTICYTSGTTGVPKGVMLTHGNVVACVAIISQVKCIGLNPQDIMISFLPLAHMYERILECAMFQIGASVGYFRGDIRALAEDIKELRPTIVPLVPRVLNRVYDKVVAELGKSFLKKAVFDIAVTFKKREARSGIVRNNSVFDKIVFKKIRESLGGRVKVVICGSAPLAENVLRFARATLGCIVLEGYGQTECVAASTLGIEADFTTGHVGIPSVCNAIKLVDVPELGYFAADNGGEVCIRGYNVFQGYFKNDALTKEVLDEDGWLHTGDIGLWTANGTLKIIDRKKHIFKLSQGEYVAPEKIENVYLQSKYVSQSFVYGESLRACLVGIVVPDIEVLTRVASAQLGLKNISLKDLCGLKQVKALIFEDMTAIGKKAGLYSFEQVKNIYLFPELFSVENDLLTPTLKSKRPNLKTFFSAQIEEMYSELL